MKPLKMWYDMPVLVADLTSLSPGSAILNITLLVPTWYVRIATRSLLLNCIQRSFLRCLACQEFQLWPSSSRWPRLERIILSKVCIEALVSTLVAFILSLGIHLIVAHFIFLWYFWAPHLLRSLWHDRLLPTKLLSSDDSTFKVGLISGSKVLCYLFCYCSWNCRGCLVR